MPFPERSCDLPTFPITFVAAGGVAPSWRAPTLLHDQHFATAMKHPSSVHHPPAQPRGAAPHPSASISEPTRGGVTRGDPRGATPPSPPYPPRQVHVEVPGSQEPQQEGVAEGLGPALPGLCLRPSPQLGHSASGLRLGEVAVPSLRHGRGPPLSPTARPDPWRGAGRRRLQSPAGLPPPPGRRGLTPPHPSGYSPKPPVLFLFFFFLFPTYGDLVFRTFCFQRIAGNFC